MIQPFRLEKDTSLGLWRLGFSAQLLMSCGKLEKHLLLAESQFPHP